MSSPLGRILERVDGVRKTRNGYLALCPSHSDSDPSLSISEAEDGRVLIKCFGGCAAGEVVAAVGLTLRDLFPPDDERPEGDRRREWPPSRSSDTLRPLRTGEFAIKSADGIVVAEHIRTDYADGSKTYYWRREGKAGLGGLRVANLPLYGVVDLAKATPGSTVVVVEGEPAREVLTENGILAVGTVTGADGTPVDDVLKVLLDCDVVLWPDNDDKGQGHMVRIAQRLTALGGSARLLAWDGAPPKGDAVDFCTSGGTVEALRELIAAAQLLDSRFAEGRDRANRGNREAPRFQLIPLVDLLAEPEPETDWVVDGMLPAGGVSVLGAKPKVGKSTLARNLALTVARGEPFLGRSAVSGPVVYLALEEKRAEVKKHFDRMGGLAESILVHFGSAPEDALAALKAAILQHAPVLAIVDPLLKFVRLRDANDYAEVTRRLEPLLALARDSGCHILCVHHLGKGERLGGDAILGSTAIFGAVDTALLMKRRDSARTIESIQRYGEDVPETVVLLDAETGRITPGRELAAIQLDEVATAVLAAVGNETLTETQIKESVGGNQTLVAKAIRALVTDRKLVRSGGGKKADPYRYVRQSTPTLDTGLSDADRKSNPATIGPSGNGPPPTTAERESFEVP